MYEIILIAIVLIITGYLVYKYVIISESSPKKWSNTPEQERGWIEQLNSLRKNIKTSKRLFDESVEMDMDPILTRNIIKDGEYIEGTTVFSDGLVKHISKEKGDVRIQLTPEQLDQINKLVEGIDKNKPICCEDYSTGSPASYLIIHKTKQMFATAGSCMVTSMKETYELYDILNKLFF